MARKITNDQERRERMAELYRSGQTLQQIGDEYGITRERVRQLIGYLGLNGQSGGLRLRAIIKAKQKHEQRAAKEEAKYRRVFGCSKDVFLEIDPIPFVFSNKRRYLKKSPGAAYFNQKRNAEVRGILWEFNLPDWWRVWRESGKWPKRGRGKGYCMARIGDSGPYSVENVYICTIGQNFSDSYLVRPWKERFPNGLGGNGRPSCGYSISKVSKREKCRYQLYIGKKYGGLFPTREAAEQAAALKRAA
jgi:hypothetical protein